MVKLEEFERSKRSTVKRGWKRASYEKAPIHALIDDLKLGHIAYVYDGQPVVVPLTFWRHGEDLYFHGANKCRLQKHLEAGGEVCVSFAESLEWVMSKSAYHHSANYRSAVVYCSGERVTDPQEFDAVFKVVIEQLEPGRWQQIRPPSPIERKATALMKLTILEGSYKSRSGGPTEEPEDLSLPVWHGVKAVSEGRENN